MIRDRLRKDTRFLRNCWYVAAHSNEVGPEPLRRVYLEEPVVLYRNADDVVALEDRCPHRFAPLSMGKIVDGGIQCPYHGLVFAASGQCVHNPHGDQRIPPSARVHKYPLVERYGLVWIWPGDPAQADDALIPDFAWLEQGAPRTRGGGHMVAAANYEICADNILDLSHADYIHPVLTSEGGSTSAPPQVTEAPRRLDVTWTWGPQPPMPTLPRHILPEKVWTRQITVWQPPACMRVFITCAETREQLDDPNLPWISGMHIMTPETALTTHYFFGGTRTLAPDDKAYGRLLVEASGQAFFEEDKPMFEAIQANLGEVTDIMSLRPLGLSGDAGSVRARSLLRRMIDSEGANRSAA